MTFFRKMAIFALCAYACICIFNDTTAEKNPDPPKIEDIPLHGGLFDSDSSPKTYLHNGNFYSEDKGRLLGVDTSFIDPLKASIYWYDKVIEEFPNTPECNQALKEKIKTIVGWKAGYGDNKRHYGLNGHTGSGEYFDMIEVTFKKLETDYPGDPHLEAYAYQVAQAYFYHIQVYKHLYPIHIFESLKAKYEEWLRKTIELARGRDTFYSHLAKMHLLGPQ